MKNKILFLCVSLFTGVFALANTDFDKDSWNIFFCTKDIDALASLGQNNPGNEGFHKPIEVYSNVNNEYHTFARHCFLMMGEVVDKINSEKIKLGYVDTIGYGADERTFEAIATKEKNIPNRVISCVKVSDDNLGFEDIMYKFARIKTLFVKTAKEKDYNIIDNNCCTVAKMIAEKEGLDTTKIHFKSFNLNGMGIEWTLPLPFGYLVSEYGLLSTSSLISSYYGYIVSSTNHKEIEKNEKPDL